MHNLVFPATESCRIASEHRVVAECFRLEIFLTPELHVSFFEQVILVAQNSTQRILLLQRRQKKHPDDIDDERRTAFNWQKPLRLEMSLLLDNQNIIHVSADKKEDQRRSFRWPFCLRWSLVFRILRANKAKAVWSAELQQAQRKSNGPNLTQGTPTMLLCDQFSTGIPGCFTDWGDPE